MQAALSIALRKQVGSTASLRSTFTIHNACKLVDKTIYPAPALIGMMSVFVPAVFTIAVDYLETACLAWQTYLKWDQMGFLGKLPPF